MNIGQYTFQVGVLVHSRLTEHDVRVENKVVRIKPSIGEERSFSTELLFVSRSIQQAADDICHSFMTGNTVGSDTRAG